MSTLDIAEDVFATCQNLLLLRLYYFNYPAAKQKAQHKHRF